MSNRKPGIETFSRDELDQLHRSAQAVIRSTDANEEIMKPVFNMTDLAGATDGSALLHASDEKYDVKEVHARVKTPAGDYVANAYQNRDPENTSAVRTSTTVERHDGEYKVHIKDPRAVKLVASLAAKQLKRKESTDHVE